MIEGNPVLQMVTDLTAVDKAIGDTIVLRERYPMLNWDTVLEHLISFRDDLVEEMAIDFPLEQ